MATFISIAQATNLPKTGSGYTSDLFLDIMSELPITLYYFKSVHSTEHEGPFFTKRLHEKKNIFSRNLMALD